MATTDEILYGDDELWKLQDAAASEVISQKIEAMKKLFQEVIAIADNADLHLHVGFDFPDGLRTGHNSYFRPEIAWNPSAKYC
jgi:hypothetical protein